MSEIHHAADRGYATGSAIYVQGRPDYPPPVRDWLYELGVGPGRSVADLGAGTGKFTPLLVETGADVIAIEPVAAMRARFAEACPRVPVLAGSAEAIPCEDSSLDAVVCAQAFHWFATPAAIAEIRRVLKPGGVLALVWNVRDERVGWVAALSTMTAAYEGDTPRYYSGAWRRVFPAPGFGPLNERQAGNDHVGSAEDVIVKRTLSVSFVAALPEHERAVLVERVRTLIAATPELRDKAHVAFPYETMMFDCRKTG